MPIVFETPQPFSPAIAEAYGRAQVSARTTPQIVEQRSQDVRSSQANMQANYDRAAAIDRQNYSNIQGALRQQGELTDNEYDRASRERMQTRALGFEQAQQEAAMQARANEVNARHQQQAQMAQLEQELAVEALSKREEGELSRLKNTYAEVMRDPTLTEQERPMVAEMLMGKIGPLQARQRLALAQQQEEHARVYQQQAQIQAETQNMTQAQLASKFQTRTVMQQNPVTGEQHYGWIDSKGDFQEFEGAKAAKPPEPFDIAKGAKDAQAEADLAYPPTLSESTEPGQRGKEVRSEANRAYATKVFERERGAHAAKQKPAAPPVPTPPTPPGQGPPQGWTPEEQRPFRRHTPESMTPRQADQVGKIEQRLEEVRSRPDLNDTQRYEFSTALNGIVNILETFGSIEAAPEKAQEEAKKHGEKLKNLPPPPMRPPTAVGGPADIRTHPRGMTPPRQGGRTIDNLFGLTG